MTFPMTHKPWDFYLYEDFHAFFLSLTQPRPDRDLDPDLDPDPEEPFWKRHLCSRVEDVPAATGSRPGGNNDFLSY